MERTIIAIHTVRVVLKGHNAFMMIVKNSPFIECTFSTHTDTPNILNTCIQLQSGWKAVENCFVCVCVCVRVCANHFRKWGHNNNRIKANTTCNILYIPSSPPSSSSLTLSLSFSLSQMQWSNAGMMFDSLLYLLQSITKSIPTPPTLHCIEW